MCIYVCMCISITLSYLSLTRCFSLSRVLRTYRDLVYIIILFKGLLRVQVQNLKWL